MPDASPSQSRHRAGKWHTVLLSLADDIVFAMLLIAVLVALVVESLITPAVAVAVGAAGMLVLGAIAYKSTLALLMMPKVNGSPVGRRGTALTELEPAGIVLIDGEHWQAISEVMVKKGTQVVVLASEGLKLTVEPIDGADAAA